MPGGDGTGPLGQGPVSGRGRGYGVNRQRKGGGTISQCVCPQCGAKIPHWQGIPCSTIPCPKCGTKMARR